MRYKGVVLKLTKNKAVVATNDFQCYYVRRNPTIYVGKEVEFSKKKIIKRNATFYMPVLGAACILLVMIYFLNFIGIININNSPQGPEVFAYVGVDINPSIEIYIDDIGDVLNLVSLNKDSKAVVRKLRAKKMNILEVVDAIINEVNGKAPGRGSEKGYMLVSSTLNTEVVQHDKQQNKQEKLNHIINSLQDDVKVRERVDVYFIQADINDRAAAKKQGISTGRYMLYEKQKDMGEAYSLEEARNVSLTELLEGLGEGKEDILNPTSKGSLSTPKPEPSDIEDTITGVTPSPVTTPTPGPTEKPTLIPTYTPKPTATPEPENTNTPTPTSTVSIPAFMRFESSNYRGHFICNKSFSGVISNNAETAEDYVFKVVRGLADPDCVSFESKSRPGYYLKHENFRIILKKYEDEDLFKNDATFRIVSGLADENMISFQSFNYTDRYIRHRLFELHIEEISTDLERKDATYIGIEVK